MLRIKQHPQLFLLLLAALLLICLFVSMNIGGIQVSVSQLLRGLFVEYDEAVASIYSIRFPRITITMLSGAALSVSGLLFQVVLRNPLADPGIIGISNGASLAASLIAVFAPQLFLMTPLFAFLGGMASFALIYCLSWKAGFQTTRILLIGVAVNYTFSAVSSLLSSANSSLTSQATALLLTWDDARILMVYLLPVLLLSIFAWKACDLLRLEDHTLRSLGIPVNLYRFVLSLLAVYLCSISVAVAGVIGFVGLIVPHLARLMIGSEHRHLLPVSAFLGAIVLLCADTLGRIVLYPYEISAGIMMAVIGGPVFILLLKRSGGYEH